LGIRLLVADDDDTVREALLDVIGFDPRFEVVGAVGSGDEAVELAAQLRPDLAVLDVRMPGGGPAAVRGVRLASPHTVVVAISADFGLGSVVPIISAGAAGYLGKGHLGLCLTEVLSSCASGGFHLAIPSGVEAFHALRSHADGGRLQSCEHG
jgi:DNA-binding NarL/FixJ family response regulator